MNYDEETLETKNIAIQKQEKILMKNYSSCTFVFSVIVRWM